MNELVSVITPLYNAEEYVRKTYESIKAQTYSNWQWIVIDDGSTDNSFQITSEFAKMDSRVCVLKRNRLPKNASTCRNIGIENSKGSYLIFLDADDLLAPSCIENRLKKMNDFPTLDFAIFRTSSFKEEEGEVQLIKELIPNNDLSDLENFLKFNYPWTTTSPIWRKEAINKINGFDEGFNRLQDPEIHIRAILGNLSYKKFDTIDSHHRLVYKGIAFPDMAKTEMIYEGYLTYIQKILIPNKQIFSDVKLLKHIRYSFSGTIRNYLLYYKLNNEIDHLSQLMYQNGLITKFQFKCFRMATFLNRKGINNKYINKLVLMPLEQ